jgi:hypothetical protein
MEDSSAGWMAVTASVSHIFMELPSRLEVLHHESASINYLLVIYEE